MDERLPRVFIMRSGRMRRSLKLIWGKRRDRTLLEIRDLWVHYGRAEAIKGISMEVEEGAIVTLIGANGAGKTTTLRAISGLKRPASGEIVFDGKRIDRLSPEKITRLGIAQIPEGRRVFPQMSAMENLEMGAFFRRDGAGIRRDLDNVFRHFPVLRERRRQLAGTLSGGGQPKVPQGGGPLANPPAIF